MSELTSHAFLLDDDLSKLEAIKSNPKFNKMVNNKESQFGTTRLHGYSALGNAKKMVTNWMLASINKYWII